MSASRTSGTSGAAAAANAALKEALPSRAELYSAMSILPQLLRLMDAMERDSASITKARNEIKEHFAKAHTLIDQLPLLDISDVNHLQLYKSCIEQRQRKRAIAIQLNLLPPSIADTMTDV